MIFSVEKLSLRLQRFLFLTTPIRFVIEMTLEWAIAAVINFSSPTFQSGVGDYISFILSVTFLALVSLFLLTVPILLFTRRPEDAIMENYFSELTEGLKVTTFSQKLFFSNFILLRLAFVAIIFALEGYLALQLMIFIGLNFLQLVYILASKPLSESNSQEIFNCSCMLLLSYNCLMFTDFVDNEDLRYYVGGYLFIGIFSANVLVNTVIIGKEAGWGIFLRVRRFYRRRLLKKSTQIREVKIVPV